MTYGGMRGPQLTSHPHLGQHAGATETRSVGVHEGESGHDTQHHSMRPGNACERRWSSRPLTTEEAEHGMWEEKVKHGKQKGECEGQQRGERWIGGGAEDGLYTSMSVRSGP